jgi:hypothetical protein
VKHILAIVVIGGVAFRLGLWLLLFKDPEVMRRLRNK